MWTGTTPTEWWYDYDNFGNLTNGMTFPKIGTSDVPVNNRPGSYNNGSATINFTFDQAGNMTAAGSTSYQWDGANRLKSVNSGTLGSYGFDGNGKRVRKAESGATTYYVYSSVTRLFRDGLFLRKITPHLKDCNFPGR